MSELEDYKKAGKIAAEALEFAKSLVKNGASLLEITNQIEAKIKELGGELAFPAQLSLDHVAAHNYPSFNDKTILDNNIVKIDIGVHINGAIGDCAATVDLSNKHQDLVDASKEALDNALKIVKAGVTTGEIGKVIQETIKNKGFVPISNLSGHGLDIFDIHDSPQIPNYDSGNTTNLQEGKVYAIEPFATNGAGKVVEAQNCELFSLETPIPVRNRITRQVLAEIEKRQGLPFAKAWLIRKFGLQTALALRELKQFEVLKEYAPLSDKNKGLVSQAEHTFRVTKEGCEILTKL